MAVRSAKEIKAAAITFLNARNKQLLTTDGEPLTDLIETVSLEQERQYVMAEYVKRTSSIAGWQSLLTDVEFQQQFAAAMGLSNTTNTISSELGVPGDLASDLEAIFYFDLERMASNYGTAHKISTYSTAVQRFYLANNNAFTLAQAEFRTTSAGAVRYTLLTPAVGMIPVMDMQESAYFVDLTIVASVAGSAGNTKADTIHYMASQPTNVIRVKNLTDASGGLSRESNENLLARLLLGQQNVATRDGLRSLLLAQSGVQDAQVVGSGESLMTRASSGATDIWVIWESQLTAQSTYQGNGKLVLTYQPLASITSVVGDSTGLVEGVDWELRGVPDGALTGSAWEGKYVQYLNTPYPSQSVVNWIYNNKIYDFQNRLDGSDPTISIPGASVLVREANKVYIDFRLRIVPALGIPYGLGQVQTYVQYLLEDYLFETKLAPNIAWSALLDVVLEATQNNYKLVDRVETYQHADRRNGVFGQKDVVLPKNEYARYGTVYWI